MAIPFIPMWMRPNKKDEIDPQDLIEERAKKNAEKIILQSQDVMHRIGLKEWWNDPDEGVLPLSGWIVLIPVIERLLTRIETLEKRD